MNMLFQFFNIKVILTYFGFTMRIIIGHKENLINALVKYITLLYCVELFLEE